MKSTKEKRITVRLTPEQYESTIETVISQCEMWTDNYEQ